MKLETKINDLQKLIASKDAASADKRERDNVSRLIARSIESGDNTPPDLSRAIEAAKNNKLRSAIFTDLPKSRREMAETTHKMALAIGHAAARLGNTYSGKTDYSPDFGNSAAAFTSTHPGEAYGGRCKYSKLDATHHVTLDPAGVVLLVESEALRLASIRDGLHLIDLRADGSCVWVERCAKQIKAIQGWIAGNGAMCFHSTKSAAHAATGYASKLAIKQKEAAARDAAARAYKASPEYKASRRARLIARLCNHAVATLADAKALGYCEPGIKAFQERFSISDTASLPALVATGDSNAVRLALTIARKMQPVTD